MRQRILTTLLALACVATATMAQALTDRYNAQRQVIIVGDNQDNIRIAKAVVEELGIPCEIKAYNDNQVLQALALGQADVAITAKPFNPEHYCASKCIIGYSLLTADTLGAVRFVGKDRQLIEAMDDTYMRLKQDGVIADIKDPKITQKEIDEEEQEAQVIEIADVLLILTGVFVVLSVLILWHIRATRRHTQEVKEMINQTEQMHNYYEIEDNQAAHELMYKYEAILCNPYVALALYDNNGQLIAENNAMKKIGHKNMVAHRKPLYNAEGKVGNYFVAVRVDKVTTA